MALHTTRLFALLVSLLLVTAIAVPGAVAGATFEDEEDGLTLEVVQDKATGNVHVNLLDDTTDDVNASLEVSGDSYVGNGSYEFPADGGLTLDEPESAANVTFYAETNDSRNISAGPIELVPRSESLSIAVNQTADGVDVLVEQYGDPVEGATVNATPTDENETYADSGERTTDENGSVTFDNPTQAVSVDFETTYDNLTASTTEELQAYGLYLEGYQDANYSVVISVEYDGEPAEGANVSVDGDYTYSGDYTTDANGTVTLNPPANDTTINVTADFEGMTATISDWHIEAEDAEGESAFAKALVRYIHFLDFENISVPPGQLISAFVHEHNPSSADDDAGPPEHAGPKNTVSASGNDTKERGPPSWAGPSQNVTEGNETAESGPPGHAKGKDKGKDKGKNGNGPPDHANGNND